MKIGRGEYYTALMLLSLYVIQRAWLILYHEYDLDQIQQQPQTENSVLGFDVAFSYLGMNAFWPLIIGVLMMAYKRSNPRGEGDSLVSDLESHNTIRYLALFIVPGAAIILHLTSIAGFTAEKTQYAFASFFPEEQGYGQPSIDPPHLTERFRDITLFVFTFGSSIFAIGSFFAPNRSERSLPKTVTAKREAKRE